MGKLKWEMTVPLENKEVVGQIESQFKITLPKLFKHLIIENNGGYANLDVFKTVNGRVEMLGRILNFNDSGSDKFINTILAYGERLKQNNLIPFGIDPAGNLICFQYVSLNCEPQIVFWVHDTLPDKEDIELIAKDFKSFLDCLYEL